MEKNQHVQDNSKTKFTLTTDRIFQPSFDQRFVSRSVVAKSIARIEKGKETRAVFPYNHKYPDSIPAVDVVLRYPATSEFSNMPVGLGLHKNGKGKVSLLTIGCKQFQGVAAQRIYDWAMANGTAKASPKKPAKKAAKKVAKKAVKK